MDPSHPTALQRWFTAPLRAGAIAAGGCVAGLGAALVLERSDVAPPKLLAGWIAVMAMSLGGAVIFGYRERARDRHEILVRALGATVYGFALSAALVAPVMHYLPSGPERPAVVTIFGVAGSMLILAARFTLFAKVADEIPITPGAIPPAPPREHAAAYALVPTEPPLPSEACEREAKAIEVRMLWGSDVLRVLHLAPPRAIHLGEDLVVGTETLGAARFPLIRVEGDRAIVTAPRGATGVIQVEGEAKHTTIDRALADGLAVADPDLPEATRIALTAGTKVTISLPTTAAPRAYRAAHGAADAAEARVVLEIAAVRAGRVVGRAPPWHGAERAIGYTAIAAVLSLGTIGFGWATRPLPFPEEDVDDISTEHIYEMSRQVMAAVERNDVSDPEPVDAPTETRTKGERDVGRDGRFRERRLWRDYDPSEGRAFKPIPELLMFGSNVVCVGWDEPLWGPVGWPRASGLGRSVVCPYPHLTPFGLRNLELPSTVDALGRDPEDAWPEQLAMARRDARPPKEGVIPTPHVEVGSVYAPTALAADAILRASRRRVADLRACHALGLAQEPTLAGDFRVSFLIGADGVLHTDSTSDGPVKDARVLDCAKSALDGIRIEAPRRMFRGSVRVSMKARR